MNLGDAFVQGSGLVCVTLPASGFDLEKSLNCGQVFHWVRFGAGWLGAIDQRQVFLEQRGGELWVPVGMEREVSEYLALDHPLDRVMETFPRDAAMDAAAVFCSGMRIFRQPLWECIATFITSSMKQVAHISQMSHALRERFGTRLEWQGQAVFSYPAPEQLAGAREEEIRACGLGYRAAHLLATARRISGGGFALRDLLSSGDEDARKALCSLPGVGEKVANCVLLFGLGRLAAVPVDVWIARILREVYFRGRRKPTAGQMREFAARHFGPYAGYAQQYLFHHARATWGRSGSVDLKRIRSVEGRRRTQKVVKKAPHNRARVQE